MYVVAISVLAVSLAYFTNVFDIFRHSDNSLDDYDQNIIRINDELSMDIILYGETIPFRFGLSYRSVDSLTLDDLETDKIHQIIILSDLDGELTITDEELIIIKEKLFNYELDFYYLGTKELTRLETLGFYSRDIADQELCLAIVSSQNQHTFYHGVWSITDVVATHDDRSTLGMLLVRQFIRSI